MNESVISRALKSRLSEVVCAEDGKYRCQMTFDSSFCGFDGHFDGNPIVPGVCIVELVRCAAEKALGRKLKMVQLAQCRFRAPLFPGNRAEIAFTFRENESAMILSADVSHDGGLVCRLRMELV